MSSGRSKRSILYDVIKQISAKINENILLYKENVNRLRKKITKVTTPHVAKNIRRRELKVDLSE